MTADRGEAEVTCPACNITLALPFTARHTGRGEAEVSVDTSAVRRHVAMHVAAEQEPERP